MSNLVNVIHLYLVNHKWQEKPVGSILNCEHVKPLGFSRVNIFLTYIRVNRAFDKAVKLQKVEIKKKVRLKFTPCKKCFTLL